MAGRGSPSAFLLCFLGALVARGTCAESSECRASNKELCAAARPGAVLAEAPVLLQRGSHVAKVSKALGKNVSTSLVGLHPHALQPFGHGVSRLASHTAATAANATTPEAPTESVEPCQYWMLEVLTDDCFEAALTNPTCETYEEGDCKAQWRGLHDLVSLGVCDAEGSQLSSDLLKSDVGGQFLFYVIQTVASVYGTRCFCKDDLSYRDPGFKSPCEGWEDFPCSGYTFSDELKESCKVSCKVCTPDTQEASAEDTVY